MHTDIRDRLAAAVAAGALAIVGAAGTASAASASATAPTLSRPVYTTGGAGYTSSGRRFRQVSATVTIPPRKVPVSDGANLLISLQAHYTPPGAPTVAVILVRPGGGAGTVEWGSNGQTVTPFAISPRVGDQLAVSIYYDRRGHDYFTVTDLTRHITKKTRATVGTVVYSMASLGDDLTLDVPPPATDIRQWKVTRARLTTYRGRHGTITGPWRTSKVILTSTGTATGRVIASPSGLSNGGANFGIWLRALPRDYTRAFAGYVADGGPFRLVAATFTVPGRPAARGNASLAYIGLSHAGGPTPRPYGYIRAQPGGGPGSITYDCLGLPAITALTISPHPGDRVSVSVYYDQHGHLRFTATDMTRGTRATATESAQLANTLPYDMAAVQVYIDNHKVTRPPADIRLWAFTGSRLITYKGVHGSLLGPWRTTEQIDTTTGTRAGPALISASLLTNAGRNFGVWLRHH
jgi:hypothetical protein